MISNNIYGIALNDRTERDDLAQDFANVPYGRPPVAPIVYMKARGSTAEGTATVKPAETLRVASTLALMLGRSASKCGEHDALGHVAAVSLAIDLSLDQGDYYRPTVHLANRPGFLSLGQWISPLFPLTIRTWIDDAPAHSWSLDRLVRPAARLIADLSSFMTLQAGDILLVGLAGDAPRIDGTHSIRAEAEGLPPVHAQVQEERP